MLIEWASIYRDIRVVLSELQKSLKMCASIGVVAGYWLYSELSEKNIKSWRWSIKQPNFRPHLNFCVLKPD